MLSHFLFLIHLVSSLQALIPLAAEGNDVGKTKASQALAKIAITSNPEIAFPGQRVRNPSYYQNPIYFQFHLLVPVRTLPQWIACSIGFLLSVSLCLIPLITIHDLTLINPCFDGTDFLCMVCVDFQGMRSCPSPVEFTPHRENCPGKLWSTSGLNQFGFL